MIDKVREEVAEWLFKNTDYIHWDLCGYDLNESITEYKHLKMLSEGHDNLALKMAGYDFDEDDIRHIKKIHEDLLIGADQIISLIQQHIPEEWDDPNYIPPNAGARTIGKASQHIPEADSSGLLRDEELWNVEEPCIQNKPCPFGIADEPVDYKGNDDKCITCGMRERAKAQLESDLKEIPEIIRSRDVQWVKYLMRRGLMLEIPALDYDASKDKSSDITSEIKREAYREVIEEVEEMGKEGRRFG